MSVAAVSSLASNRFAVPPEPVLALTVEQYHEMIRAGVLLDGDPIELLEGWLVRKMTKHPPHRVATRKTRIGLENVVPAGWSVDTQETITTSDSEPEPDVSVVRGDTAELLDRHPGPDEVGLLVEVADASLERDRGWKKRIYAAARIPIYWIVNLIDHQVEVFTQPTGSGEQADYASQRVFQPSGTIPVVLDGEEVGEIAVNDLLP